MHDVSAATDSRVYFPRVYHPDGVLIHTTAGRDSLAWLQGGSADAGQPASADYLINHAGEQFGIIPPGMAAYHAGVSAGLVNGTIYRGDALSAVLIGIELEQLNPDWCSYSQHDSLAQLVVYLAWRFSWRWPFVLLGHYEVALPAGRRSDPEGFQWGSFLGRLYVAALAAHIPGL
jgi:N-acetyl-anhydromuramyl-L-alanine amidase AmpD